MFELLRAQISTLGGIWLMDDKVCGKCIHFIACEVLYYVGPKTKPCAVEKSGGENKFKMREGNKLEKAKKNFNKSVSIL
jgi:hypothetical protein